MSRLAARVRQVWAMLGRRFLGTITSVATEEPVVALTFDDGPDPAWTPRFLETLEKHGARGTFFMVGARAAEHPELVARVARGGHAIGNHTWDHPALPQLSHGERFRQFRRCSAALGPHKTRIFRPPFGDQDIATRLDLALAGYSVVTWSVIVPDWDGCDAETLAAGIAAKIRGGSIVLLHDTLFAFSKPEFCDRSSSLRAVELLLQGTGRQFKFVTVPELLKFGPARKSLWWQARDPAFFAQYQPVGSSSAPDRR